MLKTALQAAQWLFSKARWMILETFGLLQLEMVSG